jgi:hypothetical protein
MPTSRTLTSTLRDIIKETNVDTLLTNRAIFEIFWNNIITLIERDIKSQGKIYYSNSFKPIIVKFKEVSKVEEIDIPTDCTIYKSVNSISNIMNTNIGYIVNGVTTLDGSKTFSMVSQKEYYSKLKITKGRGNYVYIKNNYIYSSNKFPLMIEALISPLYSVECGMIDKSLEIPDYLISVAYDMTLQKLSLHKSIPADTITNTNPNN